MNLGTGMFLTLLIALGLLFGYMAWPNVLEIHEAFVAECPDLPDCGGSYGGSGALLYPFPIVAAISGVTTIIYGILTAIAIRQRKKLSKTREDDP